MKYYLKLVYLCVFMLTLCLNTSCNSGGTASSTSVKTAGSLSIALSAPLVPVGQTITAVITLNNASEVNNLTVNISTQSSNLGGVAINPLSCTIINSTDQNTCNVAVTGITPGSIMLIASATGYNSVQTSLNVVRSSLYSGGSSGLIYMNSILVPGNATQIIPGDGNTTSIAAFGNHVYVGSVDETTFRGNVYTNSGNNNWAQIGGSSLPAIVSDIALSSDGENIYAASGIPLLSVYISSTSPSGKWSKVGGEDIRVRGGLISVIAVDSNNNVYAGVSTGYAAYVFVSAGGKEPWQQLGSSLPDAGETTSLAVDDAGNVYAGAYGVIQGTIYIIQPGDTDWQMFGSSPLPNGTSLSIVVDADHNVYTGGTGCQVYMAATSTAAWTSVSGILSPCFSLNSIALSNHQLYAGTQSGYVYRSTTLNESWPVVGESVIPTGYSINSIAVVDDNVYAASANFVEVSIANTAWTGAVLGSLDGSSVLSVSTFNNIQYAGTAAGNVFANTDNLAWQLLGGTAVPNAASVNSTGVDSNNNVYAATSQGVVYKSNLNTTSWEVYGGTALESSTSINALTIFESRVIIGGTDGNVYISENNSPWTAVGMNLNAKIIYSTAISNSGRYIYAGSQPTSTGSLWVYDLESGLEGNWSFLGNQTIKQQNIRSITVGKNDNVYIGAASGYVSVFSNGSWDTVGDKLDAPITCLAVDSNNSVYASSSDGNIYFLLAGTVKWLNTRYVSGLAINSIVLQQD